MNAKLLFVATVAVSALATLASTFAPAEENSAQVMLNHSAATSLIAPASIELRIVSSGTAAPERGVAKAL